MLLKSVQERPCIGIVSQERRPLTGYNGQALASSLTAYLVSTSILLSLTFNIQLTKILSYTEALSYHNQSHCKSQRVRTENYLLLVSFRLLLYGTSLLVSG